MRSSKLLGALALLILCAFAPLPAQAQLPLTGAGRQAPAVVAVGLANWRACALAAKAGTSGCAIVLEAGDSTSAGCCGGGAGASNTINYNQTKAYKAYEALLAAGLPVTYDSYCGQGTSAGDTDPPGVKTVDSRVTKSGNWAVNPSNTVSVICPGAAATAAGTLAFTPTSSISRCDVYYEKGVATGTANLNFDGGSTLATISTNGTNGTNKATVNVTLGAHTLNIVWASGSVLVSLIDCYDASAAKIRVLHTGFSGATSANWSASAATAYSPASVWALVQPALVSTNLGINDWEAGVSTGTYSTNMQAAITNYKAAYAGLDVMLTFPHSTGGSANEATQLGFGTVLSTLAGPNTSTLVSYRATQGTYATASAASKTWDTLHYNVAGQAEQGSILAAPLIVAAQ